MAPDTRSVLRRSAAHATSPLAWLTSPSHARPRRDDGPAVARGFAVTVDRFARCLHVSGEFDLAAVDRFVAAASALTVGRRGDVVVDLADLRFIDAAGLSALVVLRNSLTATGQHLVVRDVAPQFGRVFRAGGLSDLLPVSG